MDFKLLIIHYTVVEVLKDVKADIFDLVYASYLLLSDSCLHKKVFPLNSEEKDRKFSRKK